MARDELKIFAGNSSPLLTNEICKSLGVKPGDAEISTFSDSDTKVKILETVRGKDVYIIQSTCKPTNEHLMELLIFIDAAKRASADQVTAVVPWYGYARQDYMPGPRQPISAKLVANLITVAGADRILLVDVHSPATQGFFDIPVERLSAISLLVDYIKSLKLENAVIVAPDAGGVKNAKKVADAFGYDLAVINKIRPKENTAEALSVIGDVEGKTCVIFDDMIDTAGTIVEADKILRAKGAKDVYAVATHAPLSGPAIERLNKSSLKEVVVTNTIPVDEMKCPKLKVISVAPLLAEIIKRLHNKESVSIPLKNSQTNIGTFV